MGGLREPGSLIGLGNRAESHLFKIISSTTIIIIIIIIIINELENHDTEPHYLT